MTTIVEFMRAVNATTDPVRVAEVVVAHAASWLPGPCWAVVGREAGEAPAVVAGQGLRPGDDAPARIVGSWVLRRSQAWISADLSTDSRVPLGPAVAAMGFPLVCRTHTVAALVALDGQPAVATPCLPRSLSRALRLVLEPAAIALENARRIRRAERLAGTDDLTGLSNVRALTDTLRREVACASRNGQPLSVIVVDVDGFKRVNDRHGHLCGSRALSEVAALVRESMRRTDLVARLGGDEFAVVLPNTDGKGAVAAGDRLRARVARHVFLLHDGLDVRLTASVGVATASGSDLTESALLDRADGALYSAKAGGGDRTGCS